MGRTKSMIAVIAVTVAMLVASVPAAMAASVGSTVYFPYGNGATYSCSGEPPFVFDSDSRTGNCAVQQIGKPTDLVCNVTTSITFVHEGHGFVADASLCQSGASKPVAPA